MEIPQTFSKSFCNFSPYFLANGVFKKYSENNQDLMVQTFQTTNSFRTSCPENFKIIPELRRNLPVYNTYGINSMNNFQHCLFKPCPLYANSKLLGECALSKFRKQRSEKKPVPDDKKDAIYYERRKRNNRAAKKSRDARKFREDQVALKVNILENENALLKTQIIALQEEASILRHLLMKEKNI